jgi:predicted transcriptional regulator
MANFFKMFRRKGFGETLEILNSFQKGEATQNLFFKTLKKNKSYLNSFFRVKGDLLDKGLIAYKLDEEYEKVIYMTEKGKELYKQIGEIEALVQDFDENLK